MKDKTSILNKLAAECFGTFWLVFAGIGSALLAAAFPEMGIGFAGVALAVGLTVLSMAYAVGGISGAHFNPAVTLGLTIGGRFATKDLIPYWIAQLTGGIAAAAMLYLIASGQEGFTAGNFASNGYGELSPGHYNMTSAFVIECVMTAFFIIIILGATSPRAPTQLAPVAIGLGLTVIHLASIPVTNTSVNPARSTATAIFAESAALSQLWLFWAAPLIGAVIGALLWKGLLGKD